ncbi:MAG: YaiO family outer membrane beta-barrel protein [Burkholderiales bacterium]|nr:YaiO family outer membrane beta-barrel protein [Burkholderiales bacterium]
MSRNAGLRLRAAVLLGAITASATSAAASEPVSLPPPDASPDIRSGAPAVAPLLLQLAPSLGRNEIALAHARETLSNNPNDWQDTQLELIHHFAPRKLLIGRAISSKRFGLSDDTLAVSGYYPMGERTTGYAEVTTSSTHRVLPRDSIHLQLAQSLSRGWGLIGGLRRVTYNTTVVEIADLTLERYFSDYRIAFTVYPSRSRTAGNASSFRLQFSRYYGEENNIQLMAVSGTEADKPSELDRVIATPVRGIALFGRHWLTRDWGLGYGAGYTKQGDSRRRSADVGLRYRF